MKLLFKKDVDVLLAIEDGEGERSMTKLRLVSNVSYSSIQDYVEKFEGAELIDIDGGGPGREKKPKLTDKGRKVVGHLRDMRRILDG